ncbi:hypothetical protein SAMN05660903_00169 [Salegentibacter salinarum]|uniref:hypothetical protein n=1 Tax=Salegentibacter salinarum TaxID=447422 RepID=UPI0009C535D1|nr:hypothetical protein [Salegentibacter salinarum]SKB33863.1 hypothetical protein SAMN05660903_00169 [Salegentibacter salinarum]
MKLRATLLGTLFLATFFMSCEPEALPEDQPQMEHEIINIEKTASGDESNPIDDRRNED